MLALGDVETPVYPRSAIKAMQALPLVESGAADRFGLTAPELALACSSHSGEPAHVAAAAAMLAKAGRDVGTLECGVHWPDAGHRRPRAGADRRASFSAAQQLFGQARGVCVLRLRDGY